jgi:hypothetical protein
MALYDLDRGALEVSADYIFVKYVQPISKRLDNQDFMGMIKTVDQALANLKPSERSKLVWTKCAALCGYQVESKETNHMWKKAEEATTFDPDGCNKFVGSLILWRIALLENNTWLSTKTLDAGGIHPYRTYWINNEFVPFRKATAQDLAEKFGQRI